MAFSELTSISLSAMAASSFEVVVASTSVTVVSLDEHILSFILYIIPAIADTKVSAPATMPTMAPAANFLALLLLLSAEATFPAVVSLKGGDGAVDLDDVDESEDESLPPPEAAVVDGAGGGLGAEFRHASPCGPPQASLRILKGGTGSRRGELEDLRTMASRFWKSLSKYKLAQLEVSVSFQV